MKLNRSILVALACSMCVPLVHAQGAKPKPSGQMAGGAGKIGIPYKVGAKDNELQFTLEKAEFATRFMIDTDTVVADADHRLLVITFGVQNPGKTDRQFDSNSFKFTVVSPDDENFVVEAQVVHPDRRNPLGMNLKPTQKIHAIAYVKIHPQGPVNKLIVQRGEKTSVLRYDLHDLVKPLTSPFAADKGNGSINPGVAEIKTPFELGPFDFTVDSIEEMPKVSDWDPGDGKKVVVFHLTMNNVSMIKWWSTGNYQYKLYDEDGDSMDPAAIAKNSSDENFFTNPEAGAVLKYRVMFYAPAAAKFTKLVLNDLPSGRSVTIAMPPSGS